MTHTAKIFIDIEARKCYCINEENCRKRQKNSASIKEGPNYGNKKRSIFETTYQQKRRWDD